jgi:hypothetical protein
MDWTGPTDEDAYICMYSYKYTIIYAYTYIVIMYIRINSYINIFIHTYI